MIFQYLESTLHVSYCYVGQTSDKLSVYQEQPLLKWYAWISEQIYCDLENFVNSLT